MLCDIIFDFIFKTHYWHWQILVTVLWVTDILWNQKKVQKNFKKLLIHTTETDSISDLKQEAEIPGCQLHNQLQILFK